MRISNTVFALGAFSVSATNGFLVQVIDTSANRLSNTNFHSNGFCSTALAGSGKPDQETDRYGRGKYQRTDTWVSRTYISSTSGDVKTRNAKTLVQKNEGSDRYGRSPAPEFRSFRSSIPEGRKVELARKAEDRLDRYGRNPVQLNDKCVPSNGGDVKEVALPRDTVMPKKISEEKDRYDRSPTPYFLTLTQGAEKNVELARDTELPAKRTRGTDILYGKSPAQETEIGAAGVVTDEIVSRAFIFEN